MPGRVRGSQGIELILQQVVVTAVGVVHRHPRRSRMKTGSGEWGVGVPRAYFIG